MSYDPATNSFKDPSGTSYTPNHGSGSTPPPSGSQATSWNGGVATQGTIVGSYFVPNKY
jgi:hypothetical protein